ncbi:MAG: hypothetical protein H7249_05400 [Chitinophagaceae bacterium]|nr:hypothetical protein [Oligoflexus sp.]
MSLITTPSAPSTFTADSTAMLELFRERKVSRRIGLLMLISMIGVFGLGYIDYVQGNEDFLVSTLTMFAALEGGIIMGYIAVKNALVETSKAEK